LISVEFSMMGQSAAGAVDKLYRQLQHPSSMLANIGKEGVNALRDNILASTDPSGKPFAPLKNPTREKFGFFSSARLPLVKTGELLGSIHYVIVSNDTVSIGHGKKYGIFQDLGTRTIPMRTFVGFNSAAVDSVRSIVAAWVGEAMTP
jgi:phage gpG-like protein